MLDYKEENTVPDLPLLPKGTEKHIYKSFLNNMEYEANYEVQNRSI